MEFINSNLTTDAIWRY